MGKFVFAACLIGLFLTGCGEGSQTTSVPSIDAATSAPSPTESASTSNREDEVDAVLDYLIAGSMILNELPEGSLDEILTEYDRAGEQWSTAAKILGSGIADVPSSTNASMFAAVEKAVASLGVLSDCFRDPTTDNCEAEGAQASEDANALGRQSADLIPYGSRTTEEYLAALTGGGGSAESSTTAVDESPVRESVAQSNARDKAQEYLDYTAFSRKGLIAQLEYEGFTNSDATFGADSIGADWNRQAALKAQQYLDYSAFSRQGLIDQLEFEGFSRSQATYGVNAVGL